METRHARRPPPHHAATTWRDCFTHIITIVIGLLIAIGLEQTVEFFHHRHLVAETRKALDEEKQENIRSFHENVASHIMAMTFLHNNLRIFQYLREHPGTPQDKLPGILYCPSSPPNQSRLHGPRPSTPMSSRSCPARR